MIENVEYDVDDGMKAERVKQSQIKLSSRVLGPTVPAVT